MGVGFSRVQQGSVGFCWVLLGFAQYLCCCLPVFLHAYLCLGVLFGYNGTFQHKGILGKVIGVNLIMVFSLK